MSQRLKIAQAKKEQKKKKLAEKSTKRQAGAAGAGATAVNSNSVLANTTLGAFMDSVEAHAAYKSVQARFTSAVVASQLAPGDVTPQMFRYVFWAFVWLLALAILSWFSAGLLFIVASVLCYLWLATRRQSSALNGIVQPPTLRVPTQQTN